MREHECRPGSSHEWSMPKPSSRESRGHCDILSRGESEPIIRSAVDGERRALGTGSQSRWAATPVSVALVGGGAGGGKRTGAGGLGSSAVWTTGRTDGRAGGRTGRTPGAIVSVIV
eukprot:5960400-Prymnesium_polylepis.1